MKSQAVLSPRMQEATQSLVQNLLASEPFTGFQRAKNRMDADTKAQTLLKELTQTQENLRQPQANETTRQADVNALRALQAQVQTNAVIMDYAASQQEAVDFLREINNEISQLLGMNFAVLAQQSTC